MDSKVFLSYKIEERSYISFIKREIHNLVSEAGFSSVRTGEVDIIVAELTSNLIKHAGSGELIYRLTEEENANKAFEIFCLDDGYGNSNIAAMMKDGASSSNTLGQGLGAISRLSSFFQIYSMNAWGTVSYCKILQKEETSKTTRAREPIHIKPLQLCFPGEKVCGDGYHIKQTGDETQIFLGDGLGHGINAYEAVQEAIEAFKVCNENSPVEILKHIHQRVKKTRGLVGSVAILDHKKKEWSMCGIGNISTRLYQGISSKNFMSYNGIIGLNVPGRMHDTIVEDASYQNIVMCSDGLRSRWDLNKYPAIFKYDPSIIASAIFKDNARRNDDMTILVGKVNL